MNKNGIIKNNLDILVKDILTLKPENRAGRILNTEHPDKVIPLFPPEELFLTLNESEHTEALSILESASATQINYFFDIDLWMGDRLNPDKFKKWMLYLDQLDYDSLSNIIKDLNLSLIALCFSIYVNIRFSVGNDDTEELSGDTIDGVYYFSFKEDWVGSPFINFISHIKAELGAVYIEFLRSIFGAVQTEDESDEYRLRNTRLSSYGYPDYDSAVLVYKPLSLDDLIKEPKKNSRADLSNLVKNRTEAGYSSMIPNYPVLYRDEKLLLFDRIYGKAASIVQDELRFELANISNCIIVADKTGDVSSRAIRDSVLRAKSYISLSLENVTGEDEHRALLLLENYYLKSLFQHACYILNNLRLKGRAILRKGIFSAFKSREEVDDFLGEGYSPYFLGIFMHCPLYYYRDENNMDSYRDFGSAKDVNMIDDIINGLEFCSKIIHGLFKIPCLDVYDLYCRSRIDITACFSTLFLRMLWDNSPRLKPFARGELADMINILKKDESVFGEFYRRIQGYLKANIPNIAENRAVWNILKKSIFNIFDEIRDIEFIVPEDIPRMVSSIAFMD